MFEVYLGVEGLDKTWQSEFPETTKCVYCGKEARIGFVAAEVPNKWAKPEFVCQLHKNKPHSMWLHDCCAVAVYFCEECLRATALYNQARRNNDRKKRENKSR